MKSFVTKRLNGLICAIKGGLLLIKTEHSIMVQSSLFMIVICLGGYFNISKQDWINQLLAFALVLGLEGMNTAIEKISDFVHPEFDKKIGFIKDISAGAVSYAGVVALVVFLVTFVPYFY